MEPTPLRSLDPNSLNVTNTPTRVGVFPEARTPTRNGNTDKPIEKHVEDRSHILQVQTALPKICNYFDVICEIGEGAFSKVFMAKWKGQKNKRFAIKFLRPTTHPIRVLQELKCLRNIGGKDNVVKLECCLREKEAVAFIMPYIRHDSFSDYILDMSITEVQLYMKNLLTALRRVHSFDIIHRDVKPSNFLYQRKTQKFMLVDFGLAQEVDHSHDVGCSRVKRKRTIDEVDTEATDVHEPKRPVLHSLSGNVLDTEDRAKLSLKKKSPPFKENSPAVNDVTINRNINQVKRNLQFGNITAETKKEMEPRLGNECKVLGSNFTVSQNVQARFRTLVDPDPFRKPVPKLRFTLNNGCGCDKRASICNSCVRRKGMHAPRAGTPGYRSPEVLMKYPHQTTAVDIWSAGIIMLQIMSCSHPFFNATDDITALMEMVTVFGTNELRNTATKLGRHLLTCEQREPLKLDELCETLRRRTVCPRKHIVEKKQTLSEGKAAMAKDNEAINAVTQKREETPSTCHSSNQKEGSQCGNNTKLDGSNEKSASFFPKEAYDLLAKLLTVDPEKRITADAALSHPFFQMDFSSS